METQSAEIKDLALALSKVQKEIKGAATDSENPFYKSRYADLSSVWEACRALLVANGFSVVQTNGPTDGSVVTVITTLLHTSGQWIRGELTMRPIKSDPQQIGSAMTYARRYALAAIVGVCPEDDDGAKASGTDRPPRESKENKNPQRDVGTISDYIVDCIVGKSGKRKDGSAWQAWIIRTQDNGEFGTYEKRVYDACGVASADGVKITLDTEPGKFGPIIKSATIQETNAA